MWGVTVSTRTVRLVVLVVAAALAAGIGLVSAQRSSATGSDSCDWGTTIYDPIISFGVHLPGTDDICGVEAVENDAYKLYAVSHDLPLGDPRITEAGQDEIAGITWSLFLQIIQGHADDSSALSQDESGAYDWLRSKVNNYRLAAANDALAEYNEWKASPCLYQTPDTQLFWFDAADDPSCSGTFASLLEGPSPPSYQELVEMGQYDANKDIYTSSSFGGSKYASLATSKILEAQATWSMGLLGAVAPALRSVLGEDLFGEYVDLVQPFHRAAIARVNQRAQMRLQSTQRKLDALETEEELEAEGDAPEVGLEEDAALAGEDLSDAGIEGSTEAAASLGAESLSGPFFIAGIGLAILTQETIKIIDQAKIPGELQDNVNAAQAQQLADLVSNPDGGGYNNVYEDFLAQLDLGAPSVGTTGHVVSSAPDDGSVFEEEFADDSGATRYTQFNQTVSLATWPLGADQGAFGPPQETFAYAKGQIWRQIASTSDDAAVGLSGYVPSGELHYYDWSGHPRIAIVDGDEFIDESAPGSTDVGGLDANVNGCLDADACGKTNVLLALVWAEGVKPSYTTDVLTNGGFTEQRTYHQTDGSLKAPFMRVRIVLKPDTGAPAVINVDNQFGWTANAATNAYPNGGLHVGDAVTLTDPLDHPTGAATTYTWKIETRCAYQATCTADSDSAFHGNPTVTKTGKSVSFTWPAPGVYHVRLTTLDSYGHSLTSDSDQTVVGAKPSFLSVSSNVGTAGLSVYGPVDEGSEFSITGCLNIAAGEYADPHVSIDWGDQSSDSGSAGGTSTSGMSIHHGTVSGCSQPWQFTATHAYNGTSTVPVKQLPLHYTVTDGLDANDSITLNPYVNVSYESAPQFTSATSATFIAGVTNSFTFTAAGTPAATITQVDGTLPSGIGVSSGVSGDATVSGTASIADPGGDFPITLQASNDDGVVSQTFTVHVVVPPAITSSSSTTIPAGRAASIQFSASGAPTPAISIGGDTVPGMSVSADGTSLDGAPTDQGIYNLTVTAKNAGGAVVQHFTLDVGSLPNFTSPASTGFVVGNGASFNVVTTGSPTATLSLTSGSLPNGLSFTDNGDGTATIWGTPDTPGSATVRITATNLNGPTTQDLTVTASSTGGPDATVIGAPNGVSVEDIDPSAGVANLYTVAVVAGNAETLSISASPSDVTFSATGLPSSLELTDNEDGTATISGTPVAADGGDWPIEVTATPTGGGATGFVRVELQVYGPPVLTSNPLATFVAGENSSFTLTAPRLVNPTYVLAPGATLPSGLTFADSGVGTASISGTPDANAAGVSTVSVETENIFFRSPTYSTQTIEVDEAPTVTSASTASLTEGVASSSTVTTHGFPSAVLSVNGALPAGITFADNGDGTGTFSGTATDIGEVSYPVSVLATNKVATATQALTLTVGPVPQFVGDTSLTMLVGASSASLDVTSHTEPALAHLPTLSAANLPSGVTFADNGNGTGTIAGTPAPGDGGLHTVTITATSAYGEASEDVQLVIDEAPTYRGTDVLACSSPTTDYPTISYSVGSTIPTDYPPHICVSGYPVPALTLVGALPDGVSFAQQNVDPFGTFSGEVEAGGAGLYPVTLVATNSAGTVSQSLAFQADEEASPSTESLTWVAGQPNTDVVTITGYPFATINQEFAEDMPGWLTVICGPPPSTGPPPVPPCDATTRTLTLTGTPPADQAGEGVGIDLTMDQGFNNGEPTTMSIFIDIAAFGFSAASPPPPALDSAYSYHFAGTQPGLTFAVADGDTLPDGLTLASDGTLSGTPTAVGKYSFSIVATDGTDTVSTQPVEMTMQGRAHTMEISAFRLYGPKGRGDWYVSARNMTSAPIETYGWKVAVFQPGQTDPVEETLPVSTVQPGEEVTLAGPAFSLSTVDPNFSIGTPVTATAGGFELVAPDGTVSDKAGVTGAPAAAYSGSALPLPTGAQMSTQGAYVRSASGGTLVDTDDNAQDFTFLSVLHAQSISFTSSPPANAQVGSTYSLSISGGGSSSPVRLSVSSGGCVIGGSVVTFLAAGTCVVQATQAGDDVYSAAPTVSQSISVASVPAAVSGSPSTTAPAVSVVAASPNTATTAVVGSGATAVRVAVPAGALQTAAVVTLSVATPDTVKAGISIATGTVPVQLVVRNSDTSAPITHFDEPVELDFPSPSATFVPAYSQDGKTWTEIPQITSPPTLPAGWPDGWYRDRGGVIHVLTRHATYFAVLDDGSKVLAALRLTTALKRTVNLNYGHKLAVKLHSTMPATATIRLRKGAKTLGTWHAKLGTTAHAVSITLPKSARHTGAETVTVRVAAGKEAATTSTKVTLVARWLKKR